jgi:hypothetical protein
MKISIFLAITVILLSLIACTKKTSEIKYLPVAVIYDRKDSIISITRGFRCLCNDNGTIHIREDLDGQNYEVFGPHDCISSSGRCHTKLIPNPRYQK